MSTRTHPSTPGKKKKKNTSLHIVKGKQRLTQKKKKLLHHEAKVFEWRTHAFGEEQKVQSLTVEHNHLDMSFRVLC
jgi:hypothetical protein